MTNFKTPTTALSCARHKCIAPYFDDIININDLDFSKNYTKICRLETYQS